MAIATTDPQDEVAPRAQDEAAGDAFRLDDFLPYLLSVAAGRVSREFAERYRSRYGLGVAEWRLVAHLGRTQGPVSVREVHARVDLDKSKVSRAAARLEREGLIVKRTSPTDRRLVELRLTERGRALHAAIAALAVGYQQELRARLGPELAECLEEALRRLAEPLPPAGARERGREA
ncbi:MAG: MarR family transcriptional regulator, partial [Alphaproteobacteria bacterium]